MRRWTPLLCGLLGGLLLSPVLAYGQETTSSPLSTLKMGTSSAKVPAGTFLKIAFNGQLDSRITQPGEPFTATLQQDFTTPGAPGEAPRVILPVGTYVRGRVEQVKKPGLFSHGGSITLDFDHVVLPSGELLPLSLNLSTQNTVVNQKGALYTDPGVGKKVSQGVQTGVNLFTRIKEAGIESGKNMAGGFGVLVTAPAAVVGGALAGSAVTTGKAVVAVVGRGDSVVIHPGDVVTIDFGGSFNLPAN